MGAGVESMYLLDLIARLLQHLYDHACFMLPYIG